MPKPKPEPKSEQKPKPIRRKSIKEVRKDRLKSFFDRRLIEALRHEVREHILAVLNEREASTVEIGDEIGLDVTAFYKQVQILEEMDLIEEVEVRPARGAARVLRAKMTPIFDDRAWKKLPASVKANWDARVIEWMLEDLSGSFGSGTFDVRTDRHLSWTPIMLDAKGWREAMTLLAKTLYRILAIQRRSAKRIRRTGAPGIPATIGILGFERYVNPAG